jgi:hypothetical protein
MNIIVGILFVLFGLFSVVGIFVPRLRIPWRGGDRSGPVTCIGFALVFIAGGVLILFRDPSETVAPPAFGLAIGLGFLCAIIGCVLDSRSAKRRDRA